MKPHVQTFAFSLACLASAPACAQHELVVYGRLNVALENVRGGDRGGSVTRESNNRSVLGFRGSEDLGGGLSTLFQIEGTLALDTGAGAIAARDTRLGVKGRLGTVFAGNWVTPYNGATAALDPFYPTTAGYMSIMGNGSASSADNLSDTSSFDRRQQNSVHYWTPAWRGLSLRVARGLNEEKPASGARPSLGSAALVYEEGALYATLAHERHHDYQGPRRNDSGLKIAAAWRFGASRVALVGERLRYETATGTLARNAVYVSATHQVGPHGFRFGAARAGNGKGTGQVGFIKAGAGTGAVHYSAGYDYNLSKRTSVFAYYTRLENDRLAVYDFAINSVGAGTGASLQGSALGVRHAF